ncbi:MAG: response regulator [Phycisphaerales bacterium JB063]
MKVLLVDDSSTIRMIQAQALAKLGFTDIAHANDGVEALAAVAAAPPGMIMLDWNMPNMDGITFLKKYRANGGQAKVIMVTTEAEKARVIEALQAGVNNYIIKPFTPELYAKRIRETLAQKKSA